MGLTNYTTVLRWAG